MTPIPRPDPKERSVVVARAGGAPSRGAPEGGDLIAAIAGGDLSGLGILFDRYGDDVRRLHARLGASPGDVDDLVQLTFLDVLHAAPRFREGAAVRPWLFGLAAMVARRHRRFVVRMFTRLQKWTLERGDDTGTARHELEINLEAKRAEQALLSLAPKKREAFVLVAMEGMTGEEAAAVLAVPVATVWTRLHHARRELREALTGEP